MWFDCRHLRLTYSKWPQTAMRPHAYATTAISQAITAKCGDHDGYTRKSVMVTNCYSHRPFCHVNNGVITVLADKKDSVPMNCSYKYSNSFSFLGFSERYVVNDPVLRSLVRLFVCYVCDARELWINRWLFFSESICTTWQVMDVAQCEKNSAKIFATDFPQGVLCRRGWKSQKNRTIYRFISETIQYMVIVTMEDE